jgi:hypothetical protein
MDYQRMVAVAAAIPTLSAAAAVVAAAAVANLRVIGAVAPRWEVVGRGVGVSLGVVVLILAAVVVPNLQDWSSDPASSPAFNRQRHGYKRLRGLNRYGHPCVASPFATEERSRTPDVAVTGTTG